MGLAELAALRSSFVLLPSPPVGASWSLPTVAGRIVEVSGARGAPLLTIAMALVKEGQAVEQPVAWVGTRESCFYPPDAAAAGVDVEALVVVRAKESRQIPRAAGELLRSGAFALIVIDLGLADLSLAAQTRLNGLAQKHGTALVCLTKKSAAAPSLGSLVSLRAHAERKPARSGAFTCEIAVVKDKRGRPGWTHAEEHAGPEGLR
ncbi:MAG: recombinase A [Acidobacteriota bacterium]